MRLELSVNISQDIVINKINDYFQWHNLPLEMNRAGICNGLASLYAKFYLKGESAQFFEILKYISGETSGLLEQEKVNEFLRDILLTFKPELFNKKLSQANSIESLSINHVQLTSSYDIALVTSDNSWEKIIREIDLHDNEVMLVGSVRHRVSISRQENKFIIYDPNYSSGFRTFDNEQQLISELHKNVFKYKAGPLGLIISVISQPQHYIRQKVFPNLTKLYQKYQSADLLIHGPKDFDYIEKNELPYPREFFNVLYEVAISGSAESMRALVKIGQSTISKDDFINAAEVAVISNNVKTLSVLLNYIEDTELNKMLLIIKALENGRKESLDFLLNNQAAKLTYDSLMDPKFINMIIGKAARGGNFELLEKVISDCKKNMNSYLVNKNILNGTNEPIDIDTLLSYKILELYRDKDKDGIENAILSGSISCVRLLFGHVKKSINILPALQKKEFHDLSLQYLKIAIEENQPIIVDYLINEVPEELVQSISMTLEEVKKTDLSILKNLEKKGVIFSLSAQNVIAEKSHLKVGFILAVGIMLISFFEYIGLFKTSDRFNNSKEQDIERTEKLNLSRNRCQFFLQYAGEELNDSAESITFANFLNVKDAEEAPTDEDKSPKSI